MKVTRVYRLKPNDKQRSLAMQTFGCVRLMYNACLDTWNTNYQKWVDGGKQEGQFDNKLPTLRQLKQLNPWIADADSIAVTSSQMDFKQALDNYFKSKKKQRKGQKVGFPKHKKRGKCKFSYRTCNQGGNIRFSEDGKEIKLPKLGWVDVIMHRAMPEGKIGRVYVSMNKAEEFYVSIVIDTDTVETVVPKITRADNPKVVGLDMSLSSFCVSSNSDDDAIVKYVRKYRKEEEHLKKLHRRLSLKAKNTTKEVDGRKCTVEGKNHKKARINLAKGYLKTSRRRKEFVIQLSRYFAMNYDVVCIEDLNTRGMSQTLRFGKSVMDLGWGMFTQWLEYECSKYGTLLIKADKWFASSKTCNHCGHVNKGLSLSDREWVCTECGCIVDRDRNAALNLMDYAKEAINPVGTSGLDDRGVLGTIGETLLYTIPENELAEMQECSKTEGKEAAKSLA